MASMFGATRIAPWPVPPAPLHGQPGGDRGPSLRRHGSGALVGSMDDVGYMSGRDRVGMLTGNHRSQRSRDREDRRHNQRWTPPIPDLRPTGPYGARDWNDELNAIRNQIRTMTATMTTHGQEIAALLEADRMNKDQIAADRAEVMQRLETMGTHFDDRVKHLETTVKRIEDSGPAIQMVLDNLQQQCDRLNAAGSQMPPGPPPGMGRFTSGNPGFQPPQ